jgi:hypothetical protein
LPRSRHRLVIASFLALSVGSVLGACSSGGSNPDETGPTNQAVEKLRDFGLTTEQAECVVDEVGAESVVEATDLNAYTDSQQYQDAAEACIDAE